MNENQRRKSAGRENSKEFKPSKYGHKSMSPFSPFLKSSFYTKAHLNKNSVRKNDEPSQVAIRHYMSSKVKLKSDPHQNMY